MLLGFMKPDILLDHICANTPLSVNTVLLPLFRSTRPTAEAKALIRDSDCEWA